MSTRITCPECGNTSTVSFRDRNTVFAYCPACGADVGNEEEDMVDSGGQDNE